MAIYVVTYDLRHEPKADNRTALREAIKKLRWAELSESCYAVEYAGTAKQLFAHFRQHIDADDFLFVIPAADGWFGYGLKATIDGLTATLKLSA